MSKLEIYATFKVPGCTFMRFDGSPAIHHFIYFGKAGESGLDVYKCLFCSKIAILRPHERLTGHADIYSSWER